MKTSSKRSKRRDPHPCDNIVRQTINKLSFQTTMNNICHNVLFVSQEQHHVQKYTKPFYIDMSVLLGNTPLVIFTRNYIRDPSGVFSMSSLVRISMTSLPTFSLLFCKATKMANSRFVKFTEADINSFSAEQENVNRRRRKLHMM